MTFCREMIIRSLVVEYRNERINYSTVNNHRSRTPREGNSDVMVGKVECEEAKRCH